MSTLIQELEQQLDFVTAQRKATTHPRRGMLLIEQAARLRKRIERIKEAGEGHSHGKIDPDCAACQMFKMLTGDL